MAVLEKIRKRSVLLFIIIIGALLAFILGDFLNSGRSLFGPGDTMVQVDNAKVKQMDFNKQSDRLENNVKMAKANGQDLPAEMMDPGYRYQQALDNALYEKLMNLECERLGIEVTDEFISKIVADPNFAGYVWQHLMGELGENPQAVMMQLQQSGIVDPVSYLDAIKNPARYRIPEGTAQGLAQAWREMENNMAQQVQYNLYNQMLSAMLAPNKADAKAYFDNQNTMAAVQAVSVPLSSVNDSEVTLEDTDYQKFYDKIKDGYRILDENREVAYIMVPIVPSAQDYEEADSLTKSLAAAMQTEDMAEVLKNFKGFKHENRKVTEADMSRNMQFAALRLDSAGLHKGQVKELFAQRGTKSVAKVLDITTGIDNVSFTFFPVENVEQADSLFADKTVEAVDSVVRSLTSGQLVNMTASLVNPDMSTYGGNFANVAAVAEAIKTAPLNQYYFVNDSTAPEQNGVLIVKERGELTPVYDIALMSYEIYPSERTRQELSQSLHNYVVNHPTAQAFANDTTGTYNIMYAMVNPQSFTLASPQMTPGTRGVVKWVMDVAKKGSVSPVYPLTRTIAGRNGQPDQSQDYLLTAAVLDVYDDYVPYNSHMVKESIHGKVLADKKAQILIDKYAGKGKNLNEYASVMGTSPNSMNVAYGAGTIGGNAQGVLAAAKKGDLVGPVQGQNAVYVFQVDEVTAPDFDAAEMSVRLDEATRGMHMPQIGLPLLVGNRKVKNNTLKFTSTPEAE